MLVLSGEVLDKTTKKLIKIYQNYGIDISGMSDDEFERMRKLYELKGSDIDKDLNESKKYTDKFSDDIL